MTTFSSNFSNTDRPFRLDFAVSEQSTSISSNTSTVSWSITMVQTGSWNSYNSSGPSWSVNIDGQTWSGNFTYDFANYDSLTIATGVTTDPGKSAIGHNADGSKTITVSSSVNAGYPPGSASTSNSFALTNFDFTAGNPTSFGANYVAGTGVICTWAASVSYKTPVTYYLSYRSSSDGGATWGGWSGESTTTNLTYTYTGLTPGLTYQFRIRAYNGYDNYSGYAAEYPTVFLTAGGKRYTGSNWALTAAQAKRWSGSSWVTLTTAKRFDGNGWVNLS